MCDKEIQLLTELPQRPVELPVEEAEEDSPVQEIEDHVMAAFNAEPAAAEQDASGTAEPAAPAARSRRSGASRRRKRAERSKAEKA